MTHLRSLGCALPKAFEDFKRFWHTCWRRAKDYPIVLYGMPPVPALPRRMSKLEGDKLMTYVVYEADKRTGTQKDADMVNRVVWNHLPIFTKDEIYDLTCRHAERVNDSRPITEILSKNRSGRVNNDPEMHRWLSLEAAHR